MGGEPFKGLSTAALKISTVPRSDQYGAGALSQAPQMPRSLCQQSFRMEVIMGRIRYTRRIGFYNDIVALHI